MGFVVEQVQIKINQLVLDVFCDRLTLVIPLRCVVWQEVPLTFWELGERTGFTLLEAMLAGPLCAFHNTFALSGAALCTGFGYLHDLICFRVFERSSLKRRL